MYKNSVLLLAFLISLVCNAQKLIKRNIIVPKGKIANLPYLSTLKDDTNPVRYFNFKRDTSIYKPKYFYVKNVTDSTFKDSIGFVVQPKSGKRQKANFKNGLQTALTDFYNLSVQKDSTLIPIEISIHQFDLKEEKIDMYAQGVFDYKYSLHYKEGNRYIYLNEAKGNYNYRHPLLLTNKETDSVFSTVFSSHLPDLDNLANDLSDKHIYFCKGVDVAVSSREIVPQTNDSIFGSKFSQISIEDFQGDALGAEEYFKTYIGLYVNPDFNYEKGRMKIEVKTGAYFAKSESWIGSKVKKSIILNNSNYKLKLAWLESERLRKKIATYKFSCTNYSEELRQLVNFSIKQMQYVFNEYEKQTLNGANKSEQYRWEGFIEEQIKELEKNK